MLFASTPAPADRCCLEVFENTACSRWKQPQFFSKTTPPTKVVSRKLISVIEMATRETCLSMPSHTFSEAILGDLRSKMRGNGRSHLIVGEEHHLVGSDDKLPWQRDAVHGLEITGKHNRSHNSGAVDVSTCGFIF